MGCGGREQLGGDSSRSVKLDVLPMNKIVLESCVPRGYVSSDFAQETKQRIELAAGDVACALAGMHCAMPSSTAAALAATYFTPPDRTWPSVLACHVAYVAY